VELERRRVDVCGQITPQGLARSERVGEQLAATVEVELLGVVLLALPAGANTEVEPTLREHVECRGLLREERRGPERRDEDAGREPYARRHRGHRREHREWFEPRRFRRRREVAPRVRVGVRSHHDVVDDHHAIHAGVVGGAREVDETVPVARLEIAAEVRQPDRKLRRGHDQSVIVVDFGRSREDVPT
jgi:hypothetical protein